MILLKYGNTNTYYIPGNGSGLLVDTDYAGTFPAFFRALKQNGLRVDDIGYVLATHYHPDHMGLIGDLTAHGVKLLLADCQKGATHFSDVIFSRDGLPFTPIDESYATVVPCEDSREFLGDMGIHGEIIRTPSHSSDSVSLVLDDGDCLVGDLESYEYIPSYEDAAELRNDWEIILSHDPARILYSHRPAWSRR